MNVLPAGPPDTAVYRGVPRGLEQRFLNFGGREDGDEGSQGSAQSGFGPSLRVRPAAARLAMRAAVAPAPTPLSTFTTERPGEQVWSMPRMAAVPSPPRP